MVQARLTAVKPEDNPASTTLQLAFLVDRWGPEAILGPGEHLLELEEMSALLTIYRIFLKTVSTGGLKNMTAKEARLMMHVMALGTGE